MDRGAKFARREELHGGTYAMPSGLKQLASSSLSAQYDADTQELTVMFNANGQEYTHSGFPPDQWELFEKAQSKGRFYTQRIRGVY